MPEWLADLRQDVWLDIKNILFPQFCQVCGIRLLTEENGYFCPTCWEISPRIERPFCMRCGKPHPRGVGLMTSNNFLCARCGCEEPPYRRIVGGAIYADAVEEAVKLFKFHGKRRLAGPLAALMTEVLERELDPEDYTLAVPVPLYRVRQRERGYNQSLLLTQALRPALPNAFVVEALLRTRPTRTQSLIRDPEERRANIAGAFSIAPGMTAVDETILLVDDVVTTGGTVSECAHVLREAGAARVDILAAALAVPRGKDATQ